MNEIVKKSLELNDGYGILFAVLLSGIIALGTALIFIIKSGISWYKAEAEEKKRANIELLHSINSLEKRISEERTEYRLAMANLQNQVDSLRKDVQRIEDGLE